MPVVFEEENFSFNNTTNSPSAKFDTKNQESSSVAKQTMMLFFACVCVLGAYYIPKYLSPKTEAKVIYFEDITEARMRLVPVKERDDFINKLPSRSSVPQ